ncbi:DUF1198 family protein [Thalassotalea sp. Y01]|uniref:DUF1198 family protein n=1 Tax=Thalassotalea sp. Y01 TaxID=2729613 RepID=UPI00145E1D84|nr:DUF1198 family protein [Thalassotalea sp. Y01]NMP17516.1 DUF1198 domain-containing protein [Thalassotalea sp. Y01]
MIWTIVGVILLVFVIYKLGFSKANKAVSLISNKLQIKPNLVHDMIAKMSPDRGQMFVASASNSANIEQSAYIFVIYCYLMNPHPEDVKWWKGKLAESGLGDYIKSDAFTTAFVYFNLEETIDFNPRKVAEDFNAI